MKNMNASRFPHFDLSLPPWMDAHLPQVEHVYATEEERMELVIRLAELNVEHGGGPFGAAIFNLDNATLVSPGVNLVIPLRCSLAHAEMVAIAIAQQVNNTHDLGNPNMPPMQLVTSTEPCSMCLGAIPWSGITSLVCGSTEEDAENVGFDEGPKPADWIGELRARGIDIKRQLMREQAAAVLRSYAASGGMIYNGRKDQEG